MCAKQWVGDVVHAGGKSVRQAQWKLRECMHCLLALQNSRGVGFHCVSVWGEFHSTRLEMPTQLRSGTTEESLIDLTCCPYRVYTFTGESSESCVFMSVFSVVASGNPALWWAESGTFFWWSGLSLESHYLSLAI